MIPIALDFLLLVRSLAQATPHCFSEFSKWILFLRDQAGILFVMDHGLVVSVVFIRMHHTHVLFDVGGLDSLEGFCVIVGGTKTTVD